MTALLLGSAVTISVLILIALQRVAAGPTVFDRIVAAAQITAMGMILLVLIGFLFDRVDMFVDIVLAYALLAFMVPVALAKYYERAGRE